MRIEIPYRIPVFLRPELAYEVYFDKNIFFEAHKAHRAHGVHGAHRAIGPMGPIWKKHMPKPLCFFCKKLRDLLFRLENLRVTLTVYRACAQKLANACHARVGKGTIAASLPTP